MSVPSRTVYRRQSTDCLHPTPLVLLAYLPGETEQHITLSGGIDGMNVTAAFLDATGDVKRWTALCIPPEEKWHFFVSGFADWYFIAKYSTYHGRYGCSCQQRYCSHIQAIC